MAESNQTLDLKEFQLLDYLSKTEADRYKNLIEKLNLRK